MKVISKIKLSDREKYILGWAKEYGKFVSVSRFDRDWVILDKLTDRDILVKTKHESAKGIYFFEIKEMYKGLV
jgi:hypothetical protein